MDREAWELVMDTEAWELVMDTEAWRAGSQRVGNDLATKETIDKLDFIKIKTFVL